MTYRRVLKLEDNQTWITISRKTEERLVNYMHKNNMVYYEKAIIRLLRGIKK